MANMSDPRVASILAHAEACRQAFERGEKVPDLPSNLRDLAGIDLSRANLIGAKLNGAKLNGANLNSANLTDANFTDANLTGAKLEGANLRGADLTDADLDGASFRGANLKGANVILLTNSTKSSIPRPHLLLQPEEDGKLRIKRISLRY